MISHDDFDLMVKRKKAVKKTNITRLSVSSTTNSAPDSGVDRSSSDLKVKRKKAAVKKTNKNTRLSVSSTNDSVADDDSGADRSNSSSSDSDDDDESDDYDENENEKKKKKRVVTVRKPISISQSRVSLKDPIIERSVSSSPSSSPPPKVDKKLTASRVEKQDWPLDEYDAYCHQCRRKTFYAKMTCADCEKKFCVRCYAFRYALFFGFCFI